METHTLTALKNIHFTSENGLVLCEKPNREHHAEWLHITERVKKLDVNLEKTKVLFRRFYNEGEEKPYNSKPSVYIFDESSFENQTDIELHAKIWSAGEVDVYMIVGKTELKIINARRPAEIDGTNLSLEDLALWRGELEKFNDQRFSAHIFGKGMFWEQGDFYDKTKDAKFFKNKLEEENTPFHQLFAYLKQTRKELFETSKLGLNIIDKLLIICILIKFLEEIKEKKNGKVAHTLSEIYEENNIENFAESLFQNKDNGKTITILEALGNKLNGKIFDYFTEQGENETEKDFIERNNGIKNELRKIDFSPIANFLLVKLNKKGELDFDLSSKQFNIDFDFSWKQYSFRHLPIELISSIYEHFLQEDAKQLTGKTEKGVVYTPPFLVNFLIDEVMPLHKPQLNNDTFKVLDPSCGSGVFLVAAYKRLLQWWMIDFYNKNNEIPEKFDAEIFQKLLEKNIYGVDVAHKATLITIFSLTIAFLDKLSPIAFWNNLNFKKLRENIQTENFFEWASAAPRDFDLVVGNPPFNVPSDTKSKDYFKTIEPFREAVGFEYAEKMPDNLAFYFLEFARQLSLEKKLCLIIPTTLLLYSPQNTSINYRKALFENSNVEKIYDFTHLRRILFKRNADLAGNESKKKGKNKEKEENNGAEVPVCAIILTNTETQFKSIEHTVIKRLVSTEKKLRFEIDHYDRHFVRFDWACTYPFVWKCNLLGGGRLFHLIYRLSLLQNLNDFIENKNTKYKSTIKEEVKKRKPVWIDEISAKKAEDKPLNEEEQKKELKKRIEEFVDLQEQWVFEVGYEVGNEKNGKLAKYITDQSRVIAIENNKLIIDDIGEKAKYFYLPKTPVHFTPPLLLFNQKIDDNNEIPFGVQESFIKPYLVFRKSFVGLHIPQNDFDRLQQSISERIYQNIRTFSLWIFSTSSKTLINQETSFNKEDLKTLPFPDFADEEEEYLELTETEKILRDDVLEYYKHLGKSTNEDGYEPLERKLNISKTKDLEVLHHFGDAFCMNLNEIYAKNGKSWQRGKIYQTKSTDQVSEGFIIYQFGFGLTVSETKKIEVDEDYLRTLIFDDKSNRGATWVRVVRVYEHTPNGYDCVFLIKPANIRYWLRSVALRDAGDVFMDLKKTKF